MGTCGSWARESSTWFGATWDASLRAMSIFRASQTATATSGILLFTRRACSVARPATSRHARRRRARQCSAFELRWSAKTVVLSQAPLAHEHSSITIMTHEVRSSESAGSTRLRGCARDPRSEFAPEFAPAPAMRLVSFIPHSSSSLLSRRALILDEDATPPPDTNDRAYDTRRAARTRRARRAGPRARPGQPTSRRETWPRRHSRWRASGTRHRGGGRGAARARLRPLRARRPTRAADDAIGDPTRRTQRPPRRAALVRRNLAMCLAYAGKARASLREIDAAATSLHGHRARPHRGLPHPRLLAAPARVPRQSRARARRSARLRRAARLGLGGATALQPRGRAHDARPASTRARRGSRTRARSLHRPRARRRRSRRPDRARTLRLPRRRSHRLSRRTRPRSTSRRSPTGLRAGSTFGAPSARRAEAAAGGARRSRDSRSDRAAPAAADSLNQAQA